jgi:2-polyprenyl-3-methyl-5-hydroxy-6-metoxy-1,4-benzoquinol methylase
VNDYEDYADAHPTFGAEPLPLPSLESQVRNVRGTFLEVGCGDGLRLKRLCDMDLLSNYSEIIAIDISQTRIRRAALAVPIATTIVGSALEIPVQSASVDFLLSDQVIEHVPDDAAMARELFRVMRPGAQAFVGSVLKRPWAWYIYRVKGRWRLDPTHVREYQSIQEYRGLFQSAGFDVRGISTLRVSYRLSDLAIRALKLTLHWDHQRCSRAYEHNPLLRIFRHISIRIPGYFFCYASLARPSVTRIAPAPSECLDPKG